MCDLLAWPCRLQHLIAGISPDLLDGFEMRLQRGLVLEEAVRNEIEASVWAQHLGSFADEAFGNFGGLDAALVERRVGYDEVEAP